MGFNYKIYMHRQSQEVIEKFEQLEEPENSSIPQLENSSIPGVTESNTPISDQYWRSEAKNPSQSVPDIQQTNQIITQCALDVSGKFSQLLQSYGLDYLSQIVGPAEAGNLLNGIVEKTLIKVQEKIGV